MKLWLFSLLFLVVTLAFAGPKDPKQYTVQYGGFIDLNAKSIVEGSSNVGGLQPDYIIDFQSKTFNPAKEYARSLSHLPVWEKIETLAKYVRQEMLTDGSYTGPAYLEKMAEYKGLGNDIPLSEYTVCRSGVCRENGMIMHLLLKEAGVPNYYIYTKAYEKIGDKVKKEGHGFVVLEHNGEMWTADSYNKNFHKKKLSELLSSSGVVNQNGTVSKILQISDYPTVYQHKSAPTNGHGFKFVSGIYYEGPNVEVGEFVEPNELAPWDQKPILEKATPGVHLSVGTERGFLGFSMNGKATHLLLLDVDSQVVQFNKMNIGLLAVADSVGDYHKLRNCANFAKWKKMIEKNAYHISHETKQLLLKEENFNWWKGSVQTTSYRQKLDRMGNGYWQDSTLFQRLQKTAREGKAQAIRLNLTDVKQMNALADGLQSAGLQISVLDMSSAWMPRYVPDGAVESMRASLASAMKGDSILLLSKGDTKYGIWKYMSFYSSYLDQNPHVVGSPQLLESFQEFSGTKYIDSKGIVQHTPQGESLPPVNQCDGFFTRVLKLFK